MKHIILYPLISALTLSVSGVGSYLYQELSHKNNHTDTSEPDDTDDDDFVPPIEEEPGFSKMINKLMATKEPTLMLMKQIGTEELGWRGTEFYWPVLVIQDEVDTAVYTSELLK